MKMGREMPIKRSARPSSGARRSARLAAAAVRAPGQPKQQIQPTILSSSSSTSCSYQLYHLRNKHKLKQQVKMKKVWSQRSAKDKVVWSQKSAKDKGEAHIWTHEEEIALFREADKLLDTGMYSSKTKLYEDLAPLMNTLFPEVAVKFAVTTIKCKFANFNSRRIGGRPLLTCNREQIHCSETVAKFAFTTTSVSENTCSVATNSVNENNQSIPTVPKCITFVENLKGLTTNEKVQLINYMKEHPEDRESLMTFTDDEVRLLWIKGLIYPGTA